MMVDRRNIYIALLMSLALSSGCYRSESDYSSSSVDVGTSEGTSSFDLGMDRIESMSLYAQRPKWMSVSQDVRYKGRMLASEEDRVRLMFSTLRSAGDDHAFVVPKDFAKTAPASVFDHDDPSFSLLTDGIGILTLPGFGSLKASEINGFEHQLASQTDKALTKSTCGLVVDLRRNTGGNMWPMLYGVRPLLGPAPYGYFAKAHELEPWSADGGVAGDESASLAAQYPLDAPVAVLIGPETASAGEALAVAFKGRANTMFFGAPTRGLTTATQRIDVSDSYYIFASVSYLADSSGTIYRSVIAPDVRVESVGREDTVVTKAREWLETHCADAKHR